MKGFIKYYKPNKFILIIDIICAFLIAVSDLVYPMVTRELLNKIIPDKNIRIIFIIGVLLIILYVFRMICEYIVGYWGHVLGVRMEYEMRKDIFSHIQKLPVGYFDNTKTGNLMSRIVNDLNEISELAHHGPEDVFISIIMLGGSFFLLFNINVKLTLITFIIVPFMAYFSIFYNRKMKNNFRKTRESLGDVNERLEDSLTGIRIVKSFTNEKHEIEKFDVGNAKFKRLRTDAMKFLGTFGAGINFFSNISTAITLIAGGYFVAQGEMVIGDLVAFLIYINQFTQPIKRLANFVEQYQKGMAGFRRFKEIMDIESDIVEQTNAIAIKDVKGAVEFKDVNFGYNDINQVLTGVNISVKAGETIALVGPSGAGKTTICNLIPRFYEVSSGAITVDGKDIKSLTLKSLRENIGIVSQDVFLFSGTIKENIAYGNLEATEEEIIKAAELANANEFISEMPEGYDTYIGERGVKLSGGQKQRVSIARMFLKNPPILILDEATSSLDNQSEAIIQQSIEELSKNRTTFIIAHRLGTIKNAKRIIVIGENGVEEEGTHNELMMNEGVYFNLYSSQFI